MTLAHKNGTSLRAIAMAIANWFLPENMHDDLLGDLEAKNLPPLSMLASVLAWLLGIILMQLRDAFDPKLIFFEAIALAGSLAVALLGVRPGQSTIIGIAAGLVGLLFRDAHSHPLRRSPIHHGIDTLVALVFAAAIEIFEALVSPAHALPGMVMLRAFLLAFLSVSTVRIYFSPRTTEKWLPAPSFVMTQVITASWLGAGFVLNLLKPLGPQLVPEQNEFLFLAAIVSMTMAYYLQKEGIGATGGVHTNVLLDSRRQDLERKRRVLWASQHGRPQSIPWSLVLETIPFGLYALPLALALISAAPVDWLLFGSSAAAFLMLCCLWLAVRQSNIDMAAQLDREIEALKAIGDRNVIRL